MDDMKEIMNMDTPPPHCLQEAILEHTVEESEIR